MEVESEEFIIPAKATKSLVWQGATLVDWVSGGTRFELDGTVHRPRMLYDYRFDAALASPSGTFVSIFEKLGTKALLVRTSDGSLVRELNRSYYCAESYEYPITFVTLPDGTEALAHCPREYCRIDIEVAETGRCLTDEGSRKPSDVFHSRLQQSPGRTWLASAGWVWHPFDVACVWDLNAILQDPTVLDRPQVSLATDEEVGGLAFLSDDRLLGATGEESWSDEKKPNRLVMFDPATGAVLREVSLSGPGGTIHRLDEHLVLGLFGHPKLIHLSDGTVVREWSHLRTGEQNSSIIHHRAAIPAFALHPRERMFAVADEEKITVVRIKQPTHAQSSSGPPSAG
ncbi:MAG: hypothetical protein U1F77_09445 [Kiritimatiellia bacterium]